MKADQVLPNIVEKSGMKKRAISRAIGKHENYLAVTLQKKSVPQIDTMAAIANAMGYELVLRKPGEEIVIDPPGQD